MQHNEEQRRLDLLREHWRINVFQNIMSIWMAKDKRHYTEEQCRKINDTLCSGYHVLDSLEISTDEAFREFIEIMNKAYSYIELQNFSE
jgi:hypothetical protein